MGHQIRRNKLAFTLLLGFGCLLSNVSVWSQVSTYTRYADKQPAPVLPAKVLLGPGDVVSVQIFDTPELSADAVRISHSGEINLPVLGLVGVNGLNPNQAAERIEAELHNRGIMLDPHVTVSVVELAPQNATVLGEVKAPGVYPIYNEPHLMDVIALAGGFAPTAGKVVTIAHQDNPHHPVIIRLVPNALALGLQKNPKILPGDIVDVGRAGIVYILGAVGKPGGYLIDNNEHVSLIQALTLAGGWQQTAALSKARLIRKVQEGHKELMLDLKHVLNGKQADVYVENGDILYIPSSLGKTLAYRGMEAAIAAAQTAAVYVPVNGG